MKKNSFNYALADAQGTKATLLEPSQFDFARWCDYESEKSEICRSFWNAPTGLIVYRRFRVPEVFSYGCADKKRSLGLQLGALQQSMDYPADVPNFLEPWYGIGTVAASFGVEYQWHAGQSPAFPPPFETVEQALAFDAVPVEQTAIGQRTLEMIEYFLSATGGRVAMSPCDIQSPLDVAAGLVNMNNLFMAVFDNPEGLKQLLDRIADLLIEFTKRQVRMIGTALVRPGHGFASSTQFSGLGQSDDIMLMLGDEQYARFAAPSIGKVGNAFGGAVFHSCGNWSGKTAAVKSIDGLKMVDGAFGPQTDPMPNDPQPIGQAFKGTGVCLNARIVGDSETVIEHVRKLYDPRLKLIAVTYCQTAAEQAKAYESIHAMKS